MIKFFTLLFYECSILFFVNDFFDFETLKTSEKPTCYIRIRILLIQQLREIKEQSYRATSTILSTDNNYVKALIQNI